ncbi:hypothetical protein Tsubulata_030362, partial [Turnera subulata]
MEKKKTCMCNNRAIHLPTRKLTRVHPIKLFFVLHLIIALANLCTALDCQINNSKPYKFAYTITIDQSGKGNFNAIQRAVDSIPANNAKWIHIKISPGIYKEKVQIPRNKPCIFIEGAGSKLTSIEFEDHEESMTSATFISYSDNIVVKGIAIKWQKFDSLVYVSQNKFVPLATPGRVIFRPAKAVMVNGDKTAFYQCAFFGIQSTLFDNKGRHYFKECYTEGAMDFIYGAGQSIYEQCDISVNIGGYRKGILSGFITAQKKESPKETNGFVFKNCTISGIGKASLGRAWGPYSTVIFANSTLSTVVEPKGWAPWRFVGGEGNFTYMESNNKGPGADISK